MEGLYVHVASKLESVRLGKDGGGGGGGGKGGYRVFDVREVTSPEFWRAAAAELLAQALFVFLGGAAAMFTTQDDAQVIKIALAFGLAIMALVQMVGHVSGGHINPAVTVAMALTLNVSLAKAVVYLLAQVTGAVLGGFLLKGLTPSGLHGNLAVTAVSGDLTVGQGLGVEIVLTFVLVAVILATTDPHRPALGPPSLLIGLTVTLLHLSGIRFTGASMNPSRSLGSAVASDSWAAHWVYWVGPLLGGVLAAGVYKLVLSPYRNAISMDLAVQKMLQDEDFVAIPRDYFKAGGKDAKDLAASSNL